MQYTFHTGGQARQHKKHLAGRGERQQNDQKDHKQIHRDHTPERTLQIQMREPGKQ